MAVEVAERFADGEARAEELSRVDSFLLESLDALEGPWRASRGAERTALQPTYNALALALQVTRPEAPKAAYYASSNAYLALAALTHPAAASSDPGFGASQLAEERAQTDLLREIIGNPFRPSPVIARGVLAWNDGCIPKLAGSIYVERDFSAVRLGVLADALEEAGVTDEEVLGHLRKPGLHFRGCHVIDSLLGKE
jgi:hypothetical protein